MQEEEQVFRGLGEVCLFLLIELSVGDQRRHKISSRQLDKWVWGQQRFELEVKIQKSPVYKW